MEGREGGDREREVERKVSMAAACVRAKSLHLCPTLFHPVDCSLPGSSVRGILQAKPPKWVAIPSLMGSSLPRDQPPSHGFFTTCPTCGKPKRRSNSHLKYVIDRNVIVLFLSGT